MTRRMSDEAWTPASERPHHLPVLHPGSLIAGKYQIERQLGAGGMGAVYIAINQVLQKRVALKVMSGDFGGQPQAMDRFFREAMAASRVRHPAIVEIYDAGMHEGAPWMAMELLDGESLAQRIERRSYVTAGELLAIVGPVLSALSAVHAHGIVHRDLKPDNIFLERLADGAVRPKLLDFGIAKTQDALNKLTATGAVMGTAHYLAPEQARDSSTVDPRTDLYAMGVVMYEALSGRMPQAENTLPELVTKLITQVPVPLLTVAPQVPMDLANVVHWCLARDPSARPQNAQDLLVQLQRALANIPATMPSLPVSSPPPSARPVTGTGDALAGTALAAVAGPASWSPASTPAPTAPWSPGMTPPPWSPSNNWSGPPAGFGAPPPEKRSNALLYSVIGLVVLGGMCVFVMPFALGALGVATSLGAANGGGGMLDQTWPRWWEGYRVPFLVDVNGDGRRDVVGWARQNIRTDMHELLCAYDGRDGSELWCADVGEQDDITDTETVLVGEHLVYFTAHGHASAFRLRDGERLDWSADVRGEPEQVCAIGAGQVGVHTPDGLWSVLTIANGRVELLQQGPPEGCDLSAPIASPPIGVGRECSWSRRWEEAGVPRRRDLPTIRARRAFAADEMRTLLVVGVATDGPRPAAALALVRDRQLVWQQVVPSDPLRAQAHAPEAVAVGDEVVFASYGMTARGDAPRHLAAFRLADGQRLWDVPLSDARGHGWYLRADESIVLLSVNETLIAVDQGTGDVRFRIGEPASRRR